MDERTEAVLDERKQFYTAVKEFVARHGATPALETVVHVLAAQQRNSGLAKVEFSGPGMKLTINMRKMVFS